MFLGILNPVPIPIYSILIDAWYLHIQESWARTLRLAFQCVGIMYADLGTSPLYVYANTFKKGVGHEDDVLGVLSVIIYSFILFTMIKIVFIALHANDEGDGAFVGAALSSFFY
jgi:K+ transporter